MLPLLHPFVSFEVSVVESTLEIVAVELSVPAREIFRFLLGGVVLGAAAAVSDIYNFENKKLKSIRFLVKVWFPLSFLVGAFL